MSQDTHQVVVSTGAAGSVQVNHRDFPEIRSQGDSPSAAAEQLVNQLTRALDSALTTWRREAIERAITDVRAFASEGG